MIYCDTSFLLALYVPVDPFHASARRAASSFTTPIPLTLLSELELQNGIRRSLGTGIISQQDHDAIFRQISRDELEAILSRQHLDQSDHFAKARDLSKKFTPELFARSLDILHVAAALLIKVSAFASFDIRQRRLAVSAGLTVIPRQVIRSKETGA